MSRIGNRILTIPENVTVSINGNIVSVKGPKADLSTESNDNRTVQVNGNELTVLRSDDQYKNFHGTANANIKNMIIQVQRHKPIEIDGKTTNRILRDGRNIKAGRNNNIQEQDEER